MDLEHGYVGSQQTRLFFKYEGIGNDFVILNADGDPYAAAIAQNLTPKKVRWICDRHLGIGADGILVAARADRAEADIRMEVHNADGSRSAMCGNGLRCLAQFMDDRRAGDWAKPHERAPTSEWMIAAGETLHRCYRDTAGGRFSVEMGRPVWRHGDLPNAYAEAEAGAEGDWDLATGNFADLTLGADGIEHPIVPVHFGNPHAVVLAEPKTDAYAQAEVFGPMLERDPRFKAGTNVGVLVVASKDDADFDLVVHERGVGITHGCGSGACAAYCSAQAAGLWPRGKPARLRMPGGILTIVEDADGVVWQAGGAQQVFVGIWPKG